MCGGRCPGSGPHSPDVPGVLCGWPARGSRASLERVMNHDRTEGQEEAVQQQAREGDEMQRRDGLRQALVVTSQAPEAGGPGERALHNPAARQEDEAPLGLGVLDHLQADAVLGRRLGRLVPGVALVHKRQLDVLAGHGLDGVRQVADLRSFLLAGGGHQHRQQITVRVHRRVQLSRIAALGCGGRPWTNRTNTRRSCTIASKQPAAIQRWVCWYTTGQGGSSCGSNRQGAPARTIQRRALKTSRSSYRRWPASSGSSARYGATNAHSSSVTSVGYGLRARASMPGLYRPARRQFITSSRA